MLILWILLYFIGVLAISNLLRFFFVICKERFGLKYFLCCGGADKGHNADG